MRKLIRKIYSGIGAVALDKAGTTGSHVMNGSKIQPPWWNDACQEAVAAKKAATMIYKRSLTWVSYLDYKKQCAITTKILHKEKKKSWKRFCDNFNHRTPSTKL